MGGGVEHCCYKTRRTVKRSMQARKKKLRKRIKRGRRAGKGWGGPLEAELEREEESRGVYLAGGVEGGGPIHLFGNERPLNVDKAVELDGDGGGILGLLRKRTKPMLWPNSDGGSLVLFWGDKRICSWGDAKGVSLGDAKGGGDYSLCKADRQALQD